MENARKIFSVALLAVLFINMLHDVIPHVHVADDAVHSHAADSFHGNHHHSSDADSDHDSNDHEDNSLFDFLVFHHLHSNPHPEHSPLLSEQALVTVQLHAVLFDVSCEALFDTLEPDKSGLAFLQKRIEKVREPALSASPHRGPPLLG